jgi:demethylmenaquinone methyltransferase/2-methoxy-6-polyprenyl-1,4-benzoquinol methylase
MYDTPLLCIFIGCYDGAPMLTAEEQTQSVPPAGTGLAKEQAVQRMFSSIARFYDLNNSVLSLGLHHYWKRKAIEFLIADPPHPNPLPPGERDSLRILATSDKIPLTLHSPARGEGVEPPWERNSLKLLLDVGAGTGDLALLAAARLRGPARIIAADLNYPMLVVGARKIRRARERRILCVQANAERICAANGSFDAVVTGFCLRNVADLSAALREIHRVLRIGGRLICLEFSRPSAPWLRRLYDWYSFLLLPWVGTKISGDTTGVYQYLPASIRSFPDQEGLAEAMRTAGFGLVEYLNLSGGIVAIHIAVK